MYYITNSREDHFNRQLRDFNTDVYPLDSLVFFCAVWTREDNDGTIYFLLDDDNGDEIVYPVHRPVYINGRTASLKDLLRVYYGQVGVRMHRTREGSLAFDTDD